jgi:hypothetical protein
VFRDSDPITSKIAAENLDLPTRQQQTLVVLLMAPGSTHSELAQLMRDVFPSLGEMGVEHPHKRLPELKKKGLAYHGEPRPCRVTGELARVWFPVAGINNAEKSEMLEEQMGQQTEVLVRIAAALEMIASRVATPAVEAQTKAEPKVEVEPEPKVEVEPEPKVEAKDEKPAPKRRRRKKKAAGPTFADVKALVREMNTSVPAAEVTDLMEAWEIDTLNELEEADYPEFLEQVQGAINDFAAP